MAPPAFTWAVSREGSEVSVEDGEPPLAVFGELAEGLVERREEEETEEEKAVVLPVILNCRDWARMETPVAWSWIKLIWKPLPVGQPDAGGLTVVDPSEVRTFCFKTMLVFGYDAMLTKEIVKLLGSLLTEVQETV